MSVENGRTSEDILKEDIAGYWTAYFSPDEKVREGISKHEGAIGVRDEEMFDLLMLSTYQYELDQSYAGLNRAGDTGSPELYKVNKALAATAKEFREKKKDRVLSKKIRFIERAKMEALAKRGR